MSKKLMFNILAVLILASLVLTACGGGAVEAPADDKLLVGISMPTKSSTRWISDGESMVREFEALGYATDLQFADNDIPNQLAQIENMVTKGAKVLVIAAIDGTTLSDVLQTAKDNGAIVISYDRLITKTPNVERCHGGPGAGGSS
jgi:putative multiple sugar transport system substrate-binding protein